MNNMKRITNWLFTVLIGTIVGFFAERMIFGRQAQEKIISLKAELNAMRGQLRSAEQKAAGQSAEMLTLRSQLNNHAQQIAVAQEEAARLRNTLSSAEAIRTVTDLAADEGVETSLAYVSDDLAVQSAESEGMIMLPPDVGTTNEPDLLQKIEGIGPKSAAALLAAGISSFAQVAGMSADELAEIIKSAGMRRHASITTWAEQAALAAAGEWDALETLQAALDGGRRVD
jgi:predicted flap endonuclease-1-like 5' DNA nuclease